MIRLSVNEYCHNCPMFEAKICRDSYEDGWGTTRYETEIICEYEDRCQQQLKYLKELNERKDRKK